LGKNQNILNTSNNYYIIRQRNEIFGASLWMINWDIGGKKFIIVWYDDLIGHLLLQMII
jgi:hypothetical protein